MLRKKVDSWTRMGFALIVFWAVMCATELFFICLARLNTALTARVAQIGYITALRGVCLLLALAAMLSMTALLRRGLIISPLIWVAHVLRFALAGPWKDMMKNLFFVSELYNLLLVLLAPALLALLLWRSLEGLDPQLDAGRLVLPGLWAILVLAVSAGNLFVYYWSPSFDLGLWPAGFAKILLLVGLLMTAYGGIKHPWISLALYFSGFLIPLAILVAISGWYDGLNLFLTILLPFARGGFFCIWLELMLLMAAPILLSLAMNQLFAWRRGKQLLEII